jgi:hypothetical protein
MYDSPKVIIDLEEYNNLKKSVENFEKTDCSRLIFLYEQVAMYCIHPDRRMQMINNVFILQKDLKDFFRYLEKEYSCEITEEYAPEGVFKVNTPLSFKIKLK